MTLDKSWGENIYERTHDIHTSTNDYVKGAEHFQKKAIYELEKHLKNFQIRKGNVITTADIRMIEEAINIIKTLKA